MEKKEQFFKTMNDYHKRLKEYVKSGDLEKEQNPDEWLWKKIEQELDKAREEELKEVLEWNKLQQKRWGKHEDDFGKGVLSGYGWSNQHIKHLITGEECKCPI